MEHVKSIIEDVMADLRRRKNMEPKVSPIMESFLWFAPPKKEDKPREETKPKEIPERDIYRMVIRGK